MATLVGVFDRLMEAGATIIVIDHDLDLLAAADHLIDMGPGGGPDGGHILAAGTPEDVARFPGQRDRAMAGRPPAPAGSPPPRCPVSPPEPPGSPQLGACARTANTLAGTEVSR